jgi:hypothetical protein
MVLVLVVLLVPLYFGVVDGSDCGITVSTGNVTIKKCHIYVFMHTPRNYCYSWQYIQQIGSMQMVSTNTYNLGAKTKSIMLYHDRL